MTARTDTKLSKKNEIKNSVLPSGHEVQVAVVIYLVEAVETWQLALKEHRIQKNLTAVSKQIKPEVRGQKGVSRGGE